MNIKTLSLFKSNTSIGVRLKQRLKLQKNNKNNKSWNKKLMIKMKKLMKIIFMTSQWTLGK
jgi:hypothetical protein